MPVVVINPVGSAPVATGLPFINNVDFQLAAPVTLGQVVGTVTATQPVTSWSIIADSSTQLGGGAFFSIDSTGKIKITAAGVSSGSTIGYQGAPYVLTLQGTNSFGGSPSNTGYATIGIPLNVNSSNAAFPGPATVGYYNEPSFNTSGNPNGKGNLAANASITISTNGTTYQYQDFTDGRGVQVTGNNNTFIGCRFEGPNFDGACVACTGGGGAGGTGNTFSYCSFTPLASLSPHPIPMMQWPSAGTQTGVNINSAPATYAVYMIPPDNSSQFMVTMDNGSNSFDHCDFWGGANAVNQNGDGTTFSNCWVHDARNPDKYADHTDGIGYLNSGTAPNNISITNCTIASIGNTNSIAWQGATSTYANHVMSGIYLTGYACSPFHGTPTPTCTNATFHANIVGSDIAYTGNPIITDVTWTTGGTGSWRTTKFHVCPNAPQDPGNPSFTFTAADDGKFIYPDNTLHATDYTG